MTNSNDEHIYIQMLIRDDNIDNERQYTTIRQTIYSQLKRREHTVYTHDTKSTRSRIAVQHPPNTVIDSP